MTHRLRFAEEQETMFDAAPVAIQGAVLGGQDIRTVISRRSDLSTFIVHLTRDDNSELAKDRLKSIVQSRTIQARTAFGSAVKRLGDHNRALDSQKCVCFTETPLEYLHLLVGKIDGRQYDFRPYGVAITKKLARKAGVNPVWYVDITPGHGWLTNSIDDLISHCNGNFQTSEVSKIAPFIEQMGTGKGGTYQPYKKEFWWEREWRHVGHFNLPAHVLLICPENDFTEFESLANQNGYTARCIDSNWGLEQIIARLAGFTKQDVEIL
jgi:hypothetical protein